MVKLRCQQIAAHPTNSRTVKTHWSLAVRKFGNFYPCCGFQNVIPWSDSLFQRKYSMSPKQKHMSVSKKGGYPQIIHFNKVFHYKPSILGYPYFWKHPHWQPSSVRSKALPPQSLGSSSWFPCRFPSPGIALAGYKEMAESRSTGVKCYVYQISVWPETTI